MPDPLTVATAIGIGLVTGLSYGVSRYARKRHNYGEPFNPAMLGATVLLSGGIGGFFGAMGVPVTFETIAPVFSANIAVLYFLEDFLKFAFAQVGWFPKYAGRTTDVVGRDGHRDRRRG